MRIGGHFCSLNLSVATRGPWKENPTRRRNKPGAQALSSRSHQEQMVQGSGPPPQTLPPPPGETLQAGQRPPAQRPRGKGAEQEGAHSESEPGKEAGSSPARPTPTRELLPRGRALGTRQGLGPDRPGGRNRVAPRERKVGLATAGVSSLAAPPPNEGLQSRAAPAPRGGGRFPLAARLSARRPAAPAA